MNITGTQISPAFKQKLIIDPKIYRFAQGHEVKELENLKRRYQNNKIDGNLQVALFRKARIYDAMVKENGYQVEAIKNSEEKSVSAREIIDYLRQKLTPKEGELNPPFLLLNKLFNEIRQCKTGKMVIFVIDFALFCDFFRSLFVNIRKRLHFFQSRSTMTSIRPDMRESGR